MVPTERLFGYASGDAPDDRAVLVLEPSVEAFFLVHATEGPLLVKNAINAYTSGQGDGAGAQEADPMMLGSSGNDSFEAIGGSTQASTSKASAAAPQLPEDEEKFIAFAERHRAVINQILRQSTIHLTDGTFAFLVDYAKILDFDVKRRYFREELKRADQGIMRRGLSLPVNRANVFEDSFRTLDRLSPEEWKGLFRISFESEEGLSFGS